MDDSNRSISEKITKFYQPTGFINSGTYGNVYKARGINGMTGDFAIKKFKPEKEGERVYTGISQSAIREMAICAELEHPNVLQHVETILADKTIYMVFKYCDLDLLHIIHRHFHTLQRRIPACTVKSVLFQLLKGCHYLHENWIMHRDLKPANIMVTREGQVVIGDLGLARIFREPLQPLWNGDKVVVTIWYRAPELLMGARHYTPAVDLWAIGCIFAELLSLRPIFKGEEVKIDTKKTVPFQKNQMQKIVEILGMPGPKVWPSLKHYPELEKSQLETLYHNDPKLRSPLGLENWYQQILNNQRYNHGDTPGAEGFDLLRKLLHYDPELRLTAQQAMAHPYFSEKPSDNCFEGSEVQYPGRKISYDDNLITMLGTKRSVVPDGSLSGRPTKRFREL